MSSIRDDYIAPWWTYWLHNFPHVNLNFQPIDNTFTPQDQNYQQSLIFLGCVAAAGLGLNLLCLAIYLSCLCCCRKDEDEESKRPNSCCVTWSAVVAGLISCAAVGVGFYGNSETNDGVYQLTYSLYNANHTLGGVDNLVTNTMGSMESGLKQHLARLDEIFATRGDYVQTLRFMQQMADNVIKQLLGLPDWDTAKVDLAAVADQTAYIEYYRWLTYLLLLILDLVICLAACLGLAKQSRWLLTTMMVFGVLTLILSWASLGVDLATAVGTSDFCVIPDKFIMNQTKDLISSDIVHYYLYCSQTLPNPFQQSLTIFQRSLTTMQIQIQGLLQFAVPLFPTAERDLLGIQHLLNSSEASLHQLTALLDCRGLNKDYLDALIGVCYDGVEGLLYLCLFSILAICAFCAMLCAIPRAWTHIASRERDYDDIDEEDPFNPQARRMTTHNPNHATNVHSFCSYSSSMGSQSSLHPPAAQAGSNAPVSEYMNQSALFGGNQRYENVPLIGRGSPPPSVYTQQFRNRYSPSMRATYLSMTEDQIRHFGNDFQA
ncbi:protein tweety homolog 2 isoform X1 [Oncorhynchus kisutch]|uniref:Protein tweety homolog n=1 Tax=Oncorhynchus kisutch TaxID=8019 RepID=A0A8C7FKG9_ONCKI|nr:protein tweety homolog 2-like isoform X1 [Oncorhynchus kisutch]XP_031660650.1 protein tweety homolog 2-like isoform X1 [Oncorhynchus kisutch]